MKRILYYILRIIGFVFRCLSHNLSLKIIVLAHKVNGIKIIGMPASLDMSAHIDPSGGLTINPGVGISVNAIILTHDWSFLRRYKARCIAPPVDKKKEFEKQAFFFFYIGKHSLIGAGAIVLPGTNIGNYCIIGAGAVVKGNIEDYSIIVGNPGKKIGDTRDPNYKLLT